MQKQVTVLMLALGALSLIGAGCSKVETKDAMMKEKVVQEKGEMMPDQTKDEAMMKVSGQYEAYEPSKLALAAKGPVVLFFHASWCPTCKAADADIMTNLAAIPANITILKVDYDSNPELKKKYGVTYQHTFVQVDANGVMLKKWSGSSTLSDIVKETK